MVSYNYITKLLLSGSEEPGKSQRKRRMKMSLLVLNKQQLERILLVIITVAALAILAFALHTAAYGGLELGTLIEFNPGINGHCTTTACTAVGT
jgi:hypothetical protein